MHSGLICTGGDCWPRHRYPIAPMGTRAARQTMPWPKKFGCQDRCGVDLACVIQTCATLIRRAKHLLGWASFPVERHWAPDIQG